MNWFWTECLHFVWHLLWFTGVSQRLLNYLALHSLDNYFTGWRFFHCLSSLHGYIFNLNLSWYTVTFGEASGSHTLVKLWLLLIWKSFRRSESIHPVYIGNQLIPPFHFADFTGSVSILSNMNVNQGQSVVADAMDEHQSNIDLEP
jgi:hypothetical protein